jgi:hypothetical protein
MRLLLQGLSVGERGRAKRGSQASERRVDPSTDGAGAFFIWVLGHRMMACFASRLFGFCAEYLRPFGLLSF